MTDRKRQLEWKQGANSSSPGVSSILLIQSITYPAMSRHRSAAQPLRINSKKVYCSKKYCHSCWREEYHAPLIQNQLVVIALSVLTLGVFLLVRSFRCVTCGQVRSNLN